MKKEETDITIANGGMHSQTNYRKCKEMIRNNDYEMPRLYHLVFTGSSDPQVYLDALNAICEGLRANNIACKWKSAFEVDETKGLHRHVMLLVESKYAKVDYYIRYAEDGWLTLLLKQYGLRFHISQPKNKVHRTKLGKVQNYAYVTKTGPKLEDALIWCSYLYKVRSKDDSMKTIYHSSRERTKKPLPPSAAPTAAEEIEQLKGTKTHESITPASPEANPIGCSPAEQERTDSSSPCMVDAGREASASEEGRNEGSSSPSPQRYSGSRASPSYQGIEMKTLTTSQKYVGLLYERCVDQGLDVDEVRKYLLEHGVVRTPGQVAYELQHVYEFHGYVDAYPAKPRMSVRDWDRAIGPA
jgi:hypothetical protein